MSGCGGKQIVTPNGGGHLLLLKRESKADVLCSRCEGDADVGLSGLPEGLPLGVQSAEQDPWRSDDGGRWVELGTQ